MAETIDRAARRPRKRIAKGPPRPAYLNASDVDRVTIMMVALISELLTTRDQIANLRDLLARQGLLDMAELDAFRPAPDDEAAREESRLAILRRVFRVLGDEFEDYAPHAA